MSDLDTYVDRQGGRYVKIKTKRTEDTGKSIIVREVDGVLVDHYMRDRMYEGEVVLARSTGQPRRELVIVYRVDPDPKIEDDDGLRKIALNESGTRAVADVHKKTRLEPGGRIQIKVTKEAEKKNDQDTYACKFTPGEKPAEKEADPFDDDEEPF